MWKMHGGQKAVTAEEEAAWVIQHLLQVQIRQASGNKGPKPEMPDYPEGIHKLRVKADKAARNAEAWRRKHLNKTKE